MHGSTPALRIHHAQIHLHVVLNADRSLRSALRENGFNDRHREERLNCFCRIFGCSEDVDVMNNLFHTPQAASVRDALGRAFEISAKLPCKRDRPAQQIISSSSAVQLDSAEDIIDGLLLESRNT